MVSYAYRVIRGFDTHDPIIDPKGALLMQAKGWGKAVEIGVDWHSTLASPSSVEALLG